MGSDVLRQHSEKQVHGWYERLARKVDADARSQGVTRPMSGTFLLHYLGKNNGNALGAPLDLLAPEHLKSDESVTDVQAFHRSVFLTEKKGNFNPAPDRWAGLIPRLQDGRWNGESIIELNYTSLSDVAPNHIAIARLYATKPPKKWDIFTSLRGWQLKSTVRFSGKKGDTIAVTFLNWTATGEDFYDFDKNEHLTLPNPDFQSKTTDAIAPKEREITVYHTNAFRLEAVGLAKPFMVRVGQWMVSDPKLLSPAEIDPKKKLV